MNHSKSAKTLRKIQIQRDKDGGKHAGGWTKKKARKK